MGGKSDDNDNAVQQQLQPGTIPTNAPLNLSAEQGEINAPAPARLPTQPPPPRTASTGEVAASTLSVPDFLLERSPLQPQPPPRKSKLTKTDESGRAARVSEGSV